MHLKGDQELMLMGRVGVGDQRILIAASPSPTAANATMIGDIGT